MLWKCLIKLTDMKSRINVLFVIHCWIHYCMSEQHLTCFMTWFNFSVNPLKREPWEWEISGNHTHIAVKKRWHDMIYWWHDFEWASFMKLPLQICKDMQTTWKQKVTFTNARTLDLFVFTWIQWQTHHTSEVLLHKTKYWIGIFHSQKVKKLFLFHLIVDLIPMRCNKNSSFTFWVWKINLIYMLG